MNTVRLHSPAELVALLPYTIGFRPRRSVVLVGLRDRVLGVVQRIDTTDDPGLTGQVCEVLVTNLQRDGCQAAVIVGYEDRAGEAAALSSALETAVTAAGLRVADQVVVQDGRVRRRGEPFADAVTVPPDHRVPAVATFVALGHSPAASRETLASRVRPADTPLRAAVARAITQRGRGGARGPRAAAAVGWWARYLDWTAYPAGGGVAVSAVEMARLIVSLRDRRMRDLVIAWLCPGCPPMRLLDSHLVAMATATFRAAAAPEDPEIRGWLTERLCVLVDHCPDSDAPAVLSVLAAFAWYEGRGALAGIAVERALEIDPDYRLARLLDRMVRYGIRSRSDAVGGGESGGESGGPLDGAPLAG
ncbi:MAG: DUF4192 domain-containing protein [Actinomycetales bacterium]|nr:DUF4192 domain-containing protein [Actinomycetales bacterium]